MSMKRIAVSGLAGLVFMFSCSLDSNEFQGPIQGKIKVTMLDFLGSEKNNFKLLFETTNAYECSNYLILMEAGGEDDMLDLTFNEVYKDFTCTSEAAPASNEYNFGEIENGTIGINLNVKNKAVVSGTLTVSDSAFVLEMDQSPDFEFTNTMVYKMPEGMFWGSLQKYNEGQQTNDLIDDFFDLLAEAGLADTLLTEGDYTYFIVDSDSTVTLRRSGAIPAGTMSFVYYMNEDSVNRNDLRLAIADFRGIYNQYLKVDAFDWEGTIY